MYCTCYNNSTQLKVLDNDINPVPYKNSEQECLDVCDQRVFTYQRTRIPIFPDNITKIIIRADIDFVSLSHTESYSSH
jgi:hypothetical protein